MTICHGCVIIAIGLSNKKKCNFFNTEKKCNLTTTHHKLKWSNYFAFLKKSHVDEEMKIEQGR